MKIKLACWVVPHLQLENRCIKNLSIFSEILLVLYLFKGFILKWFFSKLKNVIILWHSKFLFAPTSKRSTPWCASMVWWEGSCVCVCARMSAHAYVLSIMQAYQACCCAKEVVLLKRIVRKMHIMSQNYI